ncbi:Secreted protein [Mycena sanguinolenta]|uniref:Secreted protein n=1 Tax=Mycena sanguinolenta TaxID=230812 RepID=A0A8H6Y753_9AGAR|nr:Secreted protein [Mycena sanguinolenta]
MSKKPRASDGVDLGWVDKTAPLGTPTGTSFGIPWAQGEIDKTTPISLSSNGNGIPIQTWPLAYWPDGSLKWTGHSLAADSGLSDTLHLAPGTPTEPSSPVSVSQTDSSITVTTGSFSAQFNTSGTTLIESLSLSGTAKAQNGSLVLLLQGAPDEPELAGSKPSVSTMNGNIESVTVEQSGPVRAVVKFSIPLTDLVYDRHIRFVTDAGGVWGEPVRVVSGLRRDATAAVLTPQFNGTLTPPLSAWPTSVSSEIDQLALWESFTLDQLSPSNFSISKRTTGGRASSFLNNAGFGTHASGLGYLGGASGGGVVFALRDFWQGAPRGLDIRNAASDTGTVTLWAYSPRAMAIDMRHYDTVAHGLDLAYEDVGDPDPNPVGIGRSYEMTFQVVAATPSRATLAQLASVHTVVPQIVASPTFYASQKLFGGRWNVPDTSTTGAAAIEKRHSDLLDFYVAEVEQRQFYGFWDYGDVMHTYDQTRHTWRYDVGGFAWDNGEIGTDLWLWMSFLRTGRSDLWRLSYAMTRHLSEVDFHHIGPFAGLGSRHNVNHWGDGAKEARVSGSTLKRPFYYLTTDELVGDLMDFSLQAGETIMTWDPLRKVFPPPDPAGPGRLRIGPDWTTLAGNWFTKWERTNDPQWLDKIKIGMSDIGSFKFGLFTGNTSAVGWNADTSHMVDEGGEGLGSYNLMMPFGGGEFLMEAMDLLADEEPEFDAAWVDFCRLCNAPESDILARYGESWPTGVFTQWYAKLQCYAGERLNDTSLKQAAWDVINANTTGVFGPQVQVSGTDVINPVNEIPNIATNDCAGLSLSEYAQSPPELAPNTLQVVLSRKPDPEADWEKSTTTTTTRLEEGSIVEKTAGVDKKKKRNALKRFLCF